MQLSPLFRRIGIGEDYNDHAYLTLPASQSPDSFYPSYRCFYEDARCI